MNFKSFMFILCAFIWSLTGYSQHNPENEILVFFSKGATQKIDSINHVPTKTLSFTKRGLKESLNSIGIPDSLMELALPDFKRADTLKILPDGRKLSQPDMSKLIRVKVPKGKDRKDLIKNLVNLPEVLYAEPNGRAVPQVIPTDTRFNEQWGLRNTVNPGDDIHAEAAWNIYTGNPNNIIAIIDGGTDINHEDLNAKITGGDTTWGWDGHGIHVSGIAAAESNNSQGISGVDWNARIHPQRIDNVDDAGIYQAIVDAVNYSSNVKVLNNSYGLIYENGDPGRSSTTVRLAFAFAYKANRTSVASMGNHQLTDPDVVGYPGGYDNVIAVGATDNTDVIANFSVHGNHIDVCAPGVGILSTISGGYVTMSGTSMAAPHVTGVASLLKGYNPNLANNDIANIIRLSADEVAGMNGQDFTTSYGYGRLNAERALNFLRTPFTLKQWTASSGNVESSQGLYTMQIIGASGLATGNYLVKRYEVRKTITFPEPFLHIEGVWGRGVSTSGWSQANPNFGEGFCEIVPGTLTGTGMTLRTYVYEIYTTSLQYIGYRPTSPANVNFAYTVLGVPLPTLSGPSIVCSSGTSFTVNDLPEGVTINWDQGNYVSRASTQGANPCTFSATGTGESWVEATIISDWGNVTLPRKTVWAGLTASFTGPTTILAGGSGTYTGTASCGYSPYRYRWWLRKEGTGVEGTVVGDGSTLRLTSVPHTSLALTQENSGSGAIIMQPTQRTYFDLYMVAIDNNGNAYTTNEVRITAFGNVDLILPYAMVANSTTISILPNPTDGQTTIELSSTDAQVDDASNEWDLEVYDQSQQLKAKKTKIRGKSTTLNTSGWKEGVYVVRANYSGQLLTQKLVVGKQ
ncbi:MAG TPA: S8 family serine peptidase [Sunxiuqinia sp.]|nr:S8 family serine peptidase [Sunxiuqinia sp.]